MSEKMRAREGEGEGEDSDVAVYHVIIDAQRTDSRSIQEKSSNDEMSRIPEGGRNDNVDSDLSRPPSAVSLDLPFSIYSGRAKFFLVLIISWAGFFSPLTAQIYLPAINPIAADLGVSVELVNLTITAYMIFQGFAPTIFGSLSDSLGRRPVYLACFVLYIGANIGAALSPNYACLMVMRCIQSSGSSSMIALGAGSIGDITVASERGSYMGLFMIAGMAGTCLGPLIGGILASSLGWRSTFWFLVIASFVFLIILVLFIPETLRSKVGDGSVRIKKGGILTRSVLQIFQQSKRELPEHLTTLKEPRKPRMLEPISLLFEKDVFVILSYGTITYTGFMMLCVSLPIILQSVYSLSELQVGLIFIAPGTGNIIGPLVYGKFLDREFRAVHKQYKTDTGKEYNRKSGDIGDFPIEIARLRRIWWILALYVISMASFGWLMQERVNLAGPIVFLVLSKGILSSACLTG